MTVAAEMRWCHWVKPVMVSQTKDGVDAISPSPTAGLSWNQGGQEPSGGQGDLKIGAGGALDKVAGLKSTSLSR
jgi:hypothetical protein